MYMEFLVKVELDKTEGKFASRDELADQVRDELDSANPDELEGEAGGTYSVTSWEVEEVEQKPTPKPTARKS